jgi:hypothetical protein
MHGFFYGVFIHPSVVYIEAAASLEDFKQCNRNEQELIQPLEIESRRRQLT